MNIISIRLSVLGSALACVLSLLPSQSSAVINGTEDSTGSYSAVARFRGGCSAVLIAPRVMLTSAHCMPANALSCTSLTMTPLSVNFAESSGGWSSVSSFNSRTRQVQGFVQSPGIFDLSQCLPLSQLNCAMVPLRPAIDHSQELVIMYLTDDAPADVVPLPILIHPFVNATKSAAKTAVFPTLESWIETEQPTVTTVGYGVGSQDYVLGAMQPRGRDFGLQKWIDTKTNFANLLGASNCNQLAGTGTHPGVVVSPDDLFLSDIVDATTVAPGANFPTANQSHSGGGDSGGPILVGSGIGINGETPTSLPNPSVAGGYNPDTNYIAGTASLWLSSGQTLSTAFTPTWTQSASAFLMDALYDGDGDGYADPVDSDLDEDGCENDVDQHPNDRWVPIGTSIHPNCSPSNRIWYGDEMIDTDMDGLPNCKDPDDDDDSIPDDLDNCPVHASNFCFKYGASCPLNPQFFDCRVAGCNELLVKLSSLINPDPTRDIFFNVLSADDRKIVIEPIGDVSLRESAQILSGKAPKSLQQKVLSQQVKLKRTLRSTAALTAIATNRVTAIQEGSTASRTKNIFVLETLSPDGTRSTMAVYNTARVKVEEYSGANALQLKFGKDGRSVEIAEIKFSQ